MMKIFKVKSFLIASDLAGCGDRKVNLHVSRDAKVFVCCHFLTAIPCEEAPQFSWQSADVLGERVQTTAVSLLETLSSIAKREERSTRATTRPDPRPPPID
jgi:hypothetical protein